jgi:hypothetical protein
MPSMSVCGMHRINVFGIEKTRPAEKYHQLNSKMAQLLRNGQLNAGKNGHCGRKGNVDG